jgi:hypothetical protein
MANTAKGIICVGLALVGRFLRAHIFFAIYLLVVVGVGEVVEGSIPRQFPLLSQPPIPPPYSIVLIQFFILAKVFTFTTPPKFIHSPLKKY